VKQRLKEVTDDAIERRHVFGSPFVFVDGEPFWGADRLDMIDRWLATGGW
jgi:2-hydroxychromene-2-carboxylate isomerase